MSPFPIILSAPSGGGKTTIAKTLLSRRQDLGYSVSCTTRAPRAAEVPGRDYYFISRAEFLAKREEGAFAESAMVHGNLYGTLSSEVERVLATGRHVVMDIDVQGAVQFMRAFPHSVSIFILPPSAEVLLERLRARQTESAAQLAEYEYIVMNDDLERAVSSVESIIDAETVSRERVKNLRHQVGLLIERLEQEIENSTP